MKPIKIGNKKIGKDHECYIIAEIGSNFDGSLTKAKKLIKLAKDCGANAAKFQSFTTEKILSKKGFETKTTFQSRWKKSVWEVYKDAELPREWHKDLFEFAKKNEIEYFRGESDDVLDRYYQCAKNFSVSTIVRISADDPLIDPTVVDRVIEKFYSKTSIK